MKDFLWKCIEYTVTILFYPLLVVAVSRNDSSPYWNESTHEEENHQGS